MALKQSAFNRKTVWKQFTLQTPHIFNSLQVLQTQFRVLSQIQLIPNLFTDTLYHFTILYKYVYYQPLPIALSLSIPFILPSSATHHLNNEMNRMHDIHKTTFNLPKVKLTQAYADIKCLDGSMYMRESYIFLFKPSKTFRYAISTKPDKMKFHTQPHGNQSIHFTEACPIPHNFHSINGQFHQSTLCCCYDDDDDDDTTPSIFSNQAIFQWWAKATLNVNLMYPATAKKLK